MPKIVQYLKDGTREWDFDEHPVITIGRSLSNTITIDDKALSRKHCEIRKEDESFTMVDLDSANGTFVNGARIQTQPLGADDKIRIGKTVLVFVDE